MTTSQTTHESNETSISRSVFEDPVSYLAGFGIVAEVVADTSLPAAA